MIFDSFEELWKEYGNNRNALSFDDELSLVEDLFDTYENMGFAETYEGPYYEFKENQGLRFTVDKRVSYVAGEAELECLPMWWITLENGVKFAAYPEEICLAEREDRRR